MDYFSNLKDTYQSDSAPVLKIGQVKRVHYADEQTNISKAHPEYDVIVFDRLGGQATLRNVRSANGFSGFNDYEETILEPTEVALDNSEVDEYGSNLPNKLNGALVLVAFIDADINKPLIIAGLDHPGLSPDTTETTKEKGRQKFSVFRGFEQVINKDGELELSLTGVKNADGTPVHENQPPITFKIGRNNTVTTEGGHRFIFAADENDTALVQLVTKGGQLIQVVDTPDSESMNFIHKSGAQINIGTGEVGNIQMIASDGAYMFLDAETNAISLTQKDGNIFSITGDELTMTHKDGSDIFTMTKDKIQMTSGGTLSLQPAVFGISAGTIEIKDQAEAGFKIENGQVAFGNTLTPPGPITGSTAEIFDIIDNTLDQLITNASSIVHTAVGPGVLAPNVVTALTELQVLVQLVKGSL